MNLKLLILTTSICAILTQPSYFLNQIYSSSLVEVLKLFVSEDKTIMLVVPMAVNAMLYLKNDTTYTIAQNITIPGSSSSSADMSFDGSIFALSTYSNNILVYNRISGIFSLTQTIATSDRITALSFSRDKTLLVGGSNNKSVNIFKLIGSNYVLQQSLVQSQSKIKDVKISSDKEIVIAGSSDGLCRIYLKKDNGVYDLSQILDESQIQLNGVDVSFNNSLVLTVSNDGHLRIYTKQANSTYTLSQTLLEQGYPILSVDISKDESQIVTGSNDTRVRIYTSTKNGYILNQTMTGSNGKVSSVAVYSDNSGIMVGGYDLARVRQYRSCFSVINGCSSCLSAIFCSTCSESYYYNSGQCFKCKSPCSNCISEGVCTACQNGYSLSGISCNKQLSLQEIYKLILSLTIPLFIIVTIAILVVVIVFRRLRANPRVEPETKVQSVQMQQGPKGVQLQRKRRKKVQINVTQQQLSVNEIVDSSKSHTYDTKSKMSFQ